MKKILLIFLLSISCFVSFGLHTKGGWMYYEYLGPGVNDPTKLRYKIVLKVYMLCSAQLGVQLDAQVNLSFFNAANNSFIENVSVPLASSPDIQNCTNSSCHPCISNVPLICYKIASYETIVELSPTLQGYTISYQRCCRIPSIINISAPSEIQGDTWTISIPGTQNFATAPQNSSPQFIVNDTALICAGNYFTFDFTATDPDGDSLVYSFAPAYTGGSQAVPVVTTASSPPYSSVPYSLPYSAFQPLGSSATINSNTGVVSGIAPSLSGVYVVTVLVKEYRNGIYVAESRKSLHVQVADCFPVKATLPTQYPKCDNFTQTFENLADNPSIQSWFWDFGVISQTNDTSNLQTPTFTYPDTGTYVVKLVVNRGLPCVDSSISLVKVYPGFFPGFTVSGQCKNTPIQFIDTTKATYGLVNAWRWDFGDLNTTADTSHLKNPTYIYPASGNYDVQFIVQSNKGCIDTVNKTVVIQDKPALTLSNDTLICVIDTLQLNAVGAGSIFWTPNYNINNQTSFTPLVSPDVPTKYYATLTDPFGCVGRDSVFVNVVSNVFINAGNDTTICKTDAITINTVSNAVNYLWTPSTYLNSDTAKNPLATPLATTTYYVTGSIGKCNTKDSITINVVPYPAAFAGNDTTICYGDFAQLQASGGSIYNWSPTLFLNNPNIPNPVSTPRSSIRYIVSVGDNLGCPKIVKDTVLITVQRVTADAGPRDTIIVRNQPLQLNGTGGQIYLWSPATGLDNPNIYNPIANITGNVTYVLTASTAEGCFATDTISVIVYNVPAGLYVPNAFTPNGDGINDVFRPIPIGMKEISNFKVFNRWGELVFSTSIKLQGWDGNYKGRPQDPAVYVWVVEGIDYLDKKTKQKGTVVLIR